MGFNNKGKELRTVGGAYYKGVQLTPDKNYVPSNVVLAKQFIDYKIRQSMQPYCTPVAKAAKRIALVPFDMTDEVEKTHSMKRIENEASNLGTNTLATLVEILEKNLGISIKPGIKTQKGVSRKNMTRITISHPNSTYKSYVN